MPILIQAAHGRRIATGLRAAAVALAAFAFGLQAADPAVRAAREFDLKAACLFHFAQFVEWPPAAFADAAAPFVIGVLGENPFGDSLAEIVENERVRQRPVVVRSFRRAEEARNCHILYLSPSETPRLDQILDTLADAHVLTVGETAHFTESGGAIGFLLVQNKLRLSINTGAARKADLTISSKLLRQAETVEQNRRP